MYWDKASITMLDILYVSLCILSTTYVNAGPAKRLSRMVKELYPDTNAESQGNQAQVCILGDVVYGLGEAVPSDQACLKCTCAAPAGIQCETVECSKKPGCKAVQRPNTCCPDYQCECEHNGRIYANGERLETQPGSECEVCYCRGGEFQCAEVSCYIRNDCEGKQVPGTCCPKYDHCPPKDAVPIIHIYTTQQSLNTTIPNLEQELSSLPNLLNSNTTDVEVLIPSSNELHDEEAEDTDLMLNDDNSSILPKITIQEIIPERKEIPVAPKKDYHGTLVIEEATETYSSNDLLTDASEVSEIYYPDQILHIGDKVVLLKKDVATSEIPNNTLVTVVAPQNIIEIDRIPTMNNTESILEQNPAYPPLPDSMTLETDENTEVDSKILHEVLEMRSNKSISNTTTTSHQISHPEWLKSSSKESLEVPSSETHEDILTTSEQTTFDEQNASVESDLSLEASDMTSAVNILNDTGSRKLSPLPTDVELLESSQTTLEMLDKEEVANSSSTDSDVPQVFTIEVSNNDSETVTPLSVAVRSTVSKRAVTSIINPDNVFKELSSEIDGSSLVKEVDAEDSEKIFKELLDESVTPKAANNSRKSKELEMLDKVGDALGQFVLRGGRTPDASILSVLGRFLTAQKAYDQV